MRSILKNITIPALMALLSITFTACNKDKMPGEKAIRIVLNGYNGGNNPLQMAIDTTQYHKAVANGKYIMKPGTIMELSTVYTYRPPQMPTLTVTDTITKNVIFSKQVPTTGTKAAFNFLYLDGVGTEVNPPVADPATNKLGFYIQYTDSDAPFDIFLYRKDNTTGTEYRQYLAKNIKPKTWIYVDHIPTADFDTKNLLNVTTLCFTKTGTTDQWAFKNNEMLSKITGISGLGLPLAGERGLVLPYFVTPDLQQLRYARLFFHPDRVK